jgi:hypothetical protein
MSISPRGGYVPKELPSNYTINESMSKNVYEVRLLYWCAYMNLMGPFVYFLQRRCSPFIKTYMGENSLHVASK